MRCAGKKCTLRKRGKVVKYYTVKIRIQGYPLARWRSTDVLATAGSANSMFD